METYKIISVCIVEGKTIESYWRNNMQRVFTDKGAFIDNMPGCKFGAKDAADGYNWVNEVGVEVDDANIIQHRGHNWINKF